MEFFGPVEREVLELVGDPQAGHQVSFNIDPLLDKCGREFTGIAAGKCAAKGGRIANDDAEGIVGLADLALRAIPESIGEPGRAGAEDFLQYLTGGISLPLTILPAPHETLPSFW